MQPDPHPGPHLPQGPSAGHERPPVHGEGYDPAHANGNISDTSPLPPTSPNLTTAFHRPHHTGDHDDASGVPSLRRRITQPRGEVIRVAIATPFSDADRRKERDLATDTTMAQLKDVIAQEEDASWERVGMRLVWQGRIVRDEEVLKDIVVRSDPGQVHTFHLVARRKPTRASSFAPQPTPTIPPTAVPAPAAPSAPEPIQPIAASSFSRNTQALSDSVHFVLFLVRYHLCQLLGMTPLAWIDVIPHPVVSQDIAKGAVMSVIQLHAAELSDREEGWEGWEKAFDNVAEFQWESKSRFELESEIRSLWSGRVGRAWNDGQAGEEVLVEFDEKTFKLHLPPLASMSPKQLIHLAHYLRLTSLLPLLNNFLAHSAVPAPTILRMPLPSLLPPILPRVRVRQYGLRMRVTRESLWNVLFGAIKVGGMLWMLTRGMKWSDFKMWIITGGLIGYWVGDAMGQLRPNIIWNNGNNPFDANGLPQAAPALNTHDPAEAPAQPRADAPRPTPAAPAPAGLQMPPRQSPQSGTLFTRMIPLIHLDEDAVQLHLARQRPRSQPMRIITQLLLPIALWFITLIPEWESLRDRAIRRRERAMRVWVGELTSARDAETGARQAGEGGEAPASDDALVTDTTRQSAPVFPPGLSEKARRYYERVVARGEGIDWEEEREAQRAMGVGEEEDNGAGDGMGMRML